MICIAFPNMLLKLLIPSAIFSKMIIILEVQLVIGLYKQNRSTYVPTS